MYWKEKKKKKKKSGDAWRPGEHCCVWQALLDVCFARIKYKLSKE
jgi:hypothetical protein